MLSCKQLAQQHVSEHIDGELRGSVRWSVRLHLAMCGHCRRFVGQLRTVKALITNKVEAELPLSETDAKLLASQLWEKAKERKE
jgi:predicted anti-sigma-YlaC factor YlaD